MNDIQSRESLFHDDWATSTAVEGVNVMAAFEAPTALEAQFFLHELGDLRGLRVLEVGAGLGEASVYFALRGAEVVATDLSAGMVAFQQRLAAHHRVVISSIVGPAESLSLEGQFDIVYAANLIHHLTDKPAFINAAYGFLKPGGRFVSWDPLKYNPLINLYRRMATQVRTDDERPLGTSDFRLLHGFFPDSKQRFFWLSTLVLFLKYYIVDRADPNCVRYWKRIYAETWSDLWWWRPLRWLDDRIFSRIPGFQWLAWNAVFIGEKSDANSARRFSS